MPLSKGRVLIVELIDVLMGLFQEAKKSTGDKLRQMFM